MPEYKFPSTVPGQGAITIKAPDRAEAVRRYNAMMQPQNDAALDRQNLTYGYNGAIVDQPDQASIDKWNQGIADAQAAQDPGPVYDDSGSGSGSGSGGGAPRPPWDFNADPAYQSYLAALGVTDEQARRTGANRIAEVDQQLNSTLPRIAERGIEQRRQIGEGYATRGVFRSGARLRDVALQQRAENYAVSDAASAAARQKAGLTDAMQTQIAQLARDRAEKALELTAQNAY